MITSQKKGTCPQYYPSMILTIASSAKPQTGSFLCLKVCNERRDEKKERSTITTRDLAHPEYVGCSMKDVILKINSIPWDTRDPSYANFFFSFFSSGLFPLRSRELSHFPLHTYSITFFNLHIHLLPEYPQALFSLFIFFNFLSRLYLAWVCIYSLPIRFTSCSCTLYEAGYNLTSLMENWLVFSWDEIPSWEQ